MSRDTRLDEALDNLQTLNAQYYGLTEADRQGRRGLEIYHKRITARRAIEELWAEEREAAFQLGVDAVKSELRGQLAAASLSVSPVPSEPMIGDLIDDFEEAVLAQDAERGSTTEARLALEAAFASRAVSPVPSEPPRISARMAKALLTLGFKGDEQGWPDYEGRTQAILVLRCISNSPAADSPVPEPSEPPPTCGAEANIGLRNHVCGLPTGHDGEHQCAGVLSCNTTWSSGDTPK